jgi:glutaryl-CoA dehydrogenase
MTPDHYESPDYFEIEELLSEEHIMIRDSIRDWVKKQMSPVIEDYALKGEFPDFIIRELGDLGAFGPTIPKEYGGSGLDYTSYGLIMQELERCDSGIRSTASVQGSLVMYPIYRYGTEEQRQHYLPKLASGEYLGCFGLTEPDHGSDPGAMETRIKDQGDYYLLNGSKMWISNSPMCDVAIVWAKDEQDTVRGLLVDSDLEGFSAPEIHGKWSLRASLTGELVFDNVKVPKDKLLPNVEGLKGPLSCLSSARYGIAWGALGAGMDCYDVALRFSKERTQFDTPIAGYQLTQKKLAEMITEITKGQLMALRLGQLKDAGKASPAQISMAKRNSVETALWVARESRQILGGMGITNDYPVMRHMNNLESVITYEGTHEIHLLITGMDITGISAFR